MKIGIDLGGSHVGVGIIEDAELFISKDKIFSEEDKQKVRQALSLEAQLQKEMMRFKAMYNAQKKAAENNEQDDLNNKKGRGFFKKFFK